MSFTRDKNHARAEQHVRPLLRRFAPVPAEEWRYLRTRLTLTHLPAGAALTRAGEVAEHLGFVVSGLVRKLYVSERGRPVVRGFGGPGSVVGAYVSLLTREPSYLSVEARTDTTLFVLPWSEIEVLYGRHSCWQTVGRRLAEATLVERETRAHELLTLSAAERFERFCASHREFLPELRSYDIASYLGITPVSLSRLRARERARVRAAKQRR